MTEEENKAVDLLKFYEGFFKNIGHEEEVKSIESIINYIEKLKKENEELRQNYDTATTQLRQKQKNKKKYIKNKKIYHWKMNLILLIYFKEVNYE